MKYFIKNHYDNCRGEFYYYIYYKKFFKWVPVWDWARNKPQGFKKKEDAYQYVKNKFTKPVEIQYDIRY